jgi:acyl-homoserine lactone acylase PvdQ
VGSWAGRARALAAVVVVAVAASCVAPSGPGTGDTGATGVEVWSVLPPGNGYPQGVTRRNRDDQRRPYEELDRVVRRQGLRDADLGRFFKDARIDLPPGQEVAEQRPRAGVRIRWDRWGVPHVEGSTALDVAFGAGYAVMEGRALVAELARVVGRRGAQELGVNDLFAAIDPELRIDWSDGELEARLDELLAADPVEGPLVLAELDAYLDGVNAWIERHPAHGPPALALGATRVRWERADLVAALLTVVTGASSGGGELANAAARRALADRLGQPLAARTFADLRAADAATATHVATPATYPRFDDGGGPDTPVDAASVAVPDGAVAPAAAAEPSDPKPGRSNVVAVTGERSASGRPLLVGGPQNGLTSPALLFEVSLSGGGQRARGVVAPGAGPYVFVGRSDDYAWTSTSGETDQTDVRAELLCEPDGAPASDSSDHYLFDGTCRPLELPAGAGRRTTPRSVHGPVLARGRVDGRPVAFTLQRASAGVEAVAALGLRRMNRGELTGPQDFLDAARLVPFSGHWFYVDGASIAYALVGRHPVRRAGAATDLPTWGTGEWEWQGWLDPGEQPAAVDPAGGCLHSWNNRVAPGWHAADDDWGNVGPHRVDLLVDRVCGRSGLTLADLVAAHSEAGTTDLRGEAVLPVVLEVLGDSAAPSPRAAAVRDVLAAWVRDGSARVDLDRDGWFDHPAVGVMDELFTPLVEEVFEPRLGPLLHRLPLRLDAGPRTTGSSFGSGWYGVLTRDLHGVLGRPTDASAPLACGDGSVERCRTALWRAIERAARQVRDRQLPWNREHPARWATPVVTNNGLIPVLPLVFNPVAIRWSNKPAYHLAVGFDAPDDD